MSKELHGHKIAILTAFCAAIVEQFARAREPAHA